MSRATPQQPFKRALYLSFGWVFFTLGLLGAFVPVMPTTLFMILALWGFANGSERLYEWLYYHPKFGASLRNWNQHKVIPFHAKLAAVSSMTISLVYVISFSNAQPWAVFGTTVFIGLGAVYVLSKPSHASLSQTTSNSNAKKPPKQMPGRSF